jgi:photosystem II stability/assembly factor-like uncharacterized protein
MKTITAYFLGILIVCSPALAQWSPWTEQVTGLSDQEYVWALHALDGNVAWGIAGTVSGSPCRHFVRTTDGGTTWTCGVISTAPADFNLVAINAIDGLKAWALMYHAGLGEPGESGGLFSTTDGGTTWNRAPTAFSAIGGYPGFVHFFDANNGVAVGDPADKYFEIYTTTDQGGNWSRVPKANIPPPLDVGEWTIVSEFTATANCLWCPIYTNDGGTGRYLKTTNRGATWSVEVLPNTAPKVHAVVLEFQDDNVGLAQGSPAGVQRTTDGGLTWTLIPNTSWFSLRHLEYVPNTPAMYLGTASFHSKNFTTPYAWGSVVTIDGGMTWTKLDQCAELYSDLSFGSKLAGWRTLTTGNKIYRLAVSPGRVVGVSPNSITFPTVEVGAQSEMISVDATNFGTDLLSVSGVNPLGPNFKFVEQPARPIELTTFQGARLGIAFKPATGGYLRDSIVIMSDGFNTPRVSIPLTGAAFVARPAKDKVQYVASGSLFSIETRENPPMRVDTLGGIFMHGMAVRPPTNELYGVSTATDATTLYRISSATAVAMPVQTFPIGNLRAIAFHGANKLYGATTGGSLYQLDIAAGKVTFIGFSGITYMGLVFGPRGNLWASGYKDGAYDNIYTVDVITGEATLRGRTGGNVYTTGITFSPNGVLCGLRGAGADINSVVVIDTLTGAGSAPFSTGMQGLLSIAMIGPYVAGDVEDRPASRLPVKFGLEQNYPNPFNPSTVVSYQLPVARNVKLAIYDLLGREVAVLLDEVKSPGTYEATWNAAGFSSGVYFCRMTAGAFSSTLKMVYMK